MQIGLAFAGGLVLMLIAATMFTNAVEWGGPRAGHGPRDDRQRHRRSGYRHALSSSRSWP